MQLDLLDVPPPELDRLVHDSQEGSFYHTTPWIQSLQAGLPALTFRCLAARDGDDLLGALPFFFQQRGAFRSAWSMPLGTYGGSVSRGDARIRDELTQAFVKTLDATGVYEVGWVDYHDLSREASDREPALTHLVDLEGGFERVWKERFDKKRRQRTRRARREGVTVEPTTSPEDLARFHRVYLKKMKAWGALPRLPKRLFQELLDRGDGHVRLFVARRGDEVLGGHFNFYFRDMVMAWCGLSSKESRTFQPDSLLYTTCMRDACERGFRTYNLGASMGVESLMQFKSSLGGVPTRYTLHRRRSALARAIHAVRGFTRSGRAAELDAHRAMG